MIVLDSSPLVAIIKNEEDAERYRSALKLADRVVMGAPNKLEVIMVATGRFGFDGAELVEQLIEQAEIEIADWTDPLVAFATEAFIQFGKGRHSAGLNFGDCMAYALAKSLDAPLLYKGDDFAKTDIRSVL